jgi:hypothetical protein
VILVALDFFSQFIEDRISKRNEEKKFNLQTEGVKLKLKQE